MDTRQFKDEHPKISPEEKDEISESISLSELSLNSGPYKPRVKESKQVSVRQTEVTTTCKIKTEKKEEDNSSRSTGDSRTTLSSNQSDFECGKESDDRYSCAESLCSASESEKNKYRHPLKLRLRLLREGEVPSKRGKSQQEPYYLSSNDYDKRDVTFSVATEGTGDSQARDSSAEAGTTSSRSNSRYSLRTKPAPRRRYELEEVQKVIKRKSPTRNKGRKKKEEEGSEKDDVGNGIEHTDGCSRIDFVYKRHELQYSRPGLPLPLFRKDGFAAFVAGDGRRLRRQDTELVLWRSEIHGRGLFTKWCITSGRPILEFVGEKVRKVIADLREKLYEERGIVSCYMFQIDDQMVIDATLKGWMGRFINHCCSPNCVARCVRGRIFVYALRDIKESEEITMDYGGGGDGVGNRCACGAANCRGLLAV